MIMEGGRLNIGKTISMLPVKSRKKERGGCR